MFYSHLSLSYFQCWNASFNHVVILMIVKTLQTV